jgi:alkanesulfonate monooxygenase SsuD/methylene tetrahydromethanopterin reductase-like flavin-dependent oxidoreductase (luciferase family)
MFGEDLKPHEDRYGQAAEWMDVLRRLWTEREFDFTGDQYRIVAGESFPKPLQHPHPPIMNAGGSAIGRAFAAEFADLCFVMLSGDGDLDLAREQIASYRSLARERFGREIAIWTNTTVILGETQADADAEARFLEEHQNDTATQALLATRTAGARALTLESGRELRPASLGSATIVGDAHAVAERLHDLSGAGIDGVVLIARDFEGMLTRFTRTVLPLLERAGLRAPFARAA